MRGYAGVIVIADAAVLLVQEPDFFTGEPRWTFPTGRIEDGETPDIAAARELAEEAGCMIDPSMLGLVATVAVEHQGQQLSASWNYTAVTDDTSLAPGDDPDGLVTDARWYDLADALRLLSDLPYSPKREPAIRYLTTGERDLQWTFELVDPDTRIPEFEWTKPAKEHHI